MKRPLIEACVDSYASAMAASRAGADRLELCAHLVIGGTTPTHTLFRQVQRSSGVPINVLIRPRFGDFLYTEPELEEMCEEIAAFRDLGANGVQPIEEEKFVALGADMDIIVMDAAAVKNIKPLYQEDPTMFDSCKAWQTGEVYLEMAYNAYYTNYEIALINTWFIAKSVYPDLFADVDITAKTNEITSAFLGKELADEIFACPSSFGGYQKIDTASFFA